MIICYDVYTILHSVGYDHAIDKSRVKWEKSNISLLQDAIPEPEADKH